MDPHFGPDVLLFTSSVIWKVINRNNNTDNYNSDGINNDNLKLLRTMKVTHFKTTDLHQGPTTHHLNS